MRAAPGPSERVDIDAIDDLLEPIRGWLRDYGDLVRLETPDEQVAYVARRPDHVGYVLAANAQNYTKGYGIDRVKLLLQGGLMVSEGGAWLRHKKMLQPLFHRRIAERMSGAFVSAARRVRDRWRERARLGEPIDVTADTSDFAFFAIMGAVFGRDARELARGFGIVARDSKRDLAFAREFLKLRPLVADLVARRRPVAGAPDDLVAMMMDRATLDGERFSAEEIADEIMTLVVAAHETTATTLAWVWWFLSDHPRVEAALGDVAYASQVIREAMRLCPAGWIVTRRAVGPDAFGDVTIEAGAHVLIPLFFLHRHPEYWTEPETFRPERFGPDAPPRNPFAYLPFGAGPRRCIGEWFAMTAMERHVVEIAPLLRLRRVGPREVPLEARVNLRPRDHLVMEAFLRMHA